MRLMLCSGCLEGNFKMRQLNFFSQIRAAQNMTNAFEQNRKFSQKDLETLGLPTKFANRFQK